MEEVGPSAVGLDAVRLPIDGRVAHDPADFAPRAKCASQHVAKHTPVQFASGFGRICRVGIENRVGFTVDPTLLHFIDEATAGPLPEDEQLVIGKPQELRRRFVGERIVAAQQWH